MSDNDKKTAPLGRASGQMQTISDDSTSALRIAMIRGELYGAIDCITRHAQKGLKADDPTYLSEILTLAADCREMLEEL